VWLLFKAIQRPLSVFFVRLTSLALKEMIVRVSVRGMTLAVEKIDKNLRNGIWSLYGLLGYLFSFLALCP
jgi:hypothetical protein